MNIAAAEDPSIHSEVANSVATEHSAGSAGSMVIDIDREPKDHPDVASSPPQTNVTELGNRENYSDTGRKIDNHSRLMSKSYIWTEYEKLSLTMRKLELDGSAYDRPQSSFFPYHQKLEAMRMEMPEINVITDYFWWQAHRFSNGDALPNKDVVHMIKIPIIGEAIIDELDCKRQDHAQRLQQKLNVVDTSSSIALQLIIVPDLSPVALELIGQGLKLDHRVLANHLWTRTHQPFDYPNNHEHNLHVCLQHPRTSLTVDCEINVTGDVDLRRHDWLSDFHSDQLENSRPGPHFLPPSLTKWPFWLLCPSKLEQSTYTQLHGTTRITAHHLLSTNSTPTVLILLSPAKDITYLLKSENIPGHPSITVIDYGNPFVGVTRQTSFDANSRTWNAKVGHTYNDLLDVFSKVRSEPLYYYETSLLWISKRVVTAFSKLIESDTKRLLYFKKQRQVLKRSDLLEANKRNYNPITHLRILQNKTFDKLRTIWQLSSQLRNVQKYPLRVTNGNVACLLDFNQNSVLSDFDRLEERMQEHLARVRRDLDETTIDLQRELTLLQIEDSRISIEQNIQIRKLTILAFFFVPISAVSSIFGAKVQELQLPQYQPRIWVFIVVLCTVTGASILLVTFGFVRNLLAGIQDKLEGIWVEHSFSRAFWPLFVSSRIMFLLLLPFRLLLYLQKLQDEGERIRARGKKERKERWLSDDKREEVTANLKPKNFFS